MIRRQHCFLTEVLVLDIPPRLLVELGKGMALLCQVLNEQLLHVKNQRL